MSKQTQKVKSQVVPEKPDLAFFTPPMIRYTIVPARTAIIVICMQNICLRPGPLFDPPALDMVPRLKSLLDLCRNKGIKVIHVVSALRGDGSDAGRLGEIRPMINQRKLFYQGSEDVEVYSKLKGPGDIRIEKRRYGAFYGTDLDLILRSNSIDTVIITGTATNGCCEETAREAFARDYKVIFPSDGNATHGLPDMGWGPLSPDEAQRATLTLVASSLGQVASIKELVDEIRLAPSI